MYIVAKGQRPSAVQWSLETHALRPGNYSKVGGALAHGCPSGLKGILGSAGSVRQGMQDTLSLLKAGLGGATEAFFAARCCRTSRPRSIRRAG
jgi:predicted lipid-binding transport protein (Tim44 family)